MSPKRRISKRKVAGLVLLFAGVMAAILWNRQPSKPIVAPPQQPEQAAAPLAETPPARVEQPPPIEPVKEPAVQPSPKPKVQSQAQAPTAKEPLHDPDARDALALVGLDPNAEQYWLEAIYDTSLPDNEREDLMEDLNETGFADPKNLTSDDLPLILSRLEIIDAILPNTDDFMAQHLLEAQKDLMNMFGKVGQH